MNGSRSNTPRSGNPGSGAYGDRSSLDALNRTIEGLEARIEGLMGTGGREQQRGRDVLEREMPAPRLDPVSEIMQRQRTLNASRERDAIRERVQPRQEARYEERRPVQAPVLPKREMPLPERPLSERLRSEVYRSEPFPSEPARREPVRQEPIRQENLRQENYRQEMPRQDYVRQEAVRREPLRSEQFRSEPQRPDPAMAEIAQSLVGLRQELKKDIADGLAREMETLRAEIRGITADAGQDQALAEDMRGDLQRLADSINQLGKQASPAQTDELKHEFDDLRSMIEGLAREDSVRRMETRWTGVEDRLNVFDTNRDDELVALAYRLDEIKSQIGTMNNGPALHALEDKLVSVAQAIELIGRHMQPDDHRMASQFSDLDARLDEISRAIVASGRTAAPDSPAVTRVEGRLADLSRQIDNLSAAPNTSGVDRMEGHLADLSRRIDRLAAAPDTSGVDRVEHHLVDLSRRIDVLSRPTDNGLSARIEALTARVEELANEEAAVRLEERIEQLSMMMERSQKASVQPDLTGYLSDISRKIDALDQGAVNDALAERLDDLARRIDSLDAAPVSFAGNDRFTRLEDQLTDIAIRLEETHAAPQDDSEILRSLQDQIANLSSLVSQPREIVAPAAVPAEFEGRMTALEEYLATSDEYIIEAARQAAEAVMEAYSKNGGIGQAASGGTDMAAISALADDLKVLENLSRSSEDRTARTFEALHETLVHIAEKLERLEERGVAQEAPRPFGLRDYQEQRQPEMPKATQPVFNDHEDPFAEVQIGRRYEDLKRDMHAMAAEAESAVALHPEVADVAEALVVSEPAIVEKADAKSVTAPAKTSLLAGLAKRFSGKRAEPVRAVERQLVDPTPPMDASETIEPDVANQLLEPGSGVPDVKKILERVRAGQNARAAQPSEGDKADFIAAARRAAQLAVEEVDTLNRGKTSSTPSSIGGAFARHRRPILMAVGAVLLAIMSYPLVNTLIRGDRAPVEAPVAVIEQPVAKDVPATADVAPVTPAEDNAEDTKVEPLSTLQPHAGEDAAGEDAVGQDGGMDDGGQPATAEPQMSQPETQTPEQTVPQAEPVKPATDGASQMLAPAGSDTAASLDAQNADAAKTDAAAPVAAADIAVPAEVKPEALAEAAKKGDPAALFEIGVIYTEGRGVKADLAEAAKWYQRSADAGVIPAQYRLASLYEKGSGVARDVSKARALYQEAAEKGNASAMHNLAVMLASGGASSPDFAAAGQWFGKAAEHGVRDSQFNLAILYARGNGVKQDLEESYKWFAVAARDGDADAAQKRDEVSKVLKPEQLKSAKAKFDAWKVTPVDPAANAVDVPDAWVGKGVKTASVDMKKALRNIQAILNNNGFNAGKPDGEMGQKTVSAIKAFQKSIGQEPTGQITDALVKELLKRNG
ncbi:MULTISPECIES: peptidoglycan-binding protein [unclassified Rhizobium]|uniref:peptidoglycan-binding protein n=1 Tax=unclassified Rhizobium TaxID=2613769 RepID=UPI0007155F13|nr:MULTISPECIES: peptidoglycan-binding protein [unclassified Rhizobium]KQS90776.1 peptidoglycan-binding protein [Rhizobium sp. Leaf391]KQS95866.1 peptidoglycan-binding protein [Rhizobium sp. Leaf386]KQU10060.1 peptidoglycan-binding protein [Rhizobium sp. Leaf453]